MNLRQVYEELKRQHDEITLRRWSDPFSLLFSLSEERVGLKMGLEEAITLLRPLVDAMPEVHMDIADDVYIDNELMGGIVKAPPKRLTFCPEMRPEFFARDLRAIADKMEEK